MTVTRGSVLSTEYERNREMDIGGMILVGGMLFVGPLAYAVNWTIDRFQGKGKSDD